MNCFDAPIWFWCGNINCFQCSHFVWLARESCKIEMGPNQFQLLFDCLLREIQSHEEQVAVSLPGCCIMHALEWQCHAGEGWRQMVSLPHSSITPGQCWLTCQQWPGLAPLAPHGLPARFVCLAPHHIQFWKPNGGNSFAWDWSVTKMSLCVKYIFLRYLFEVKSFCCDLVMGTFILT